MSVSEAKTQERIADALEKIVELMKEQNEMAKKMMGTEENIEEE